MKTTFKDIDEYIGIQTPEVQILLEQIRQTIKNAAPEAEEVISYNMPAFKYHGMLVYFAAYKNHIGFYATPTGHSQFKEELSVYKQGKGSVQFPLTNPLPLDLITKIVKFRVRGNLKGKSN
ncbi:DUF1801 domain-containing protein [Flavobacterium sp.]|uniref:iron chaperone n=1 Tax=Flavobacterium sp. TaxID=239 RepID=UPI0025BA738A|nr:DUF1801 domain-containing protein [Flavobacterium sp.]MBA4276162.1 hypothetical protein [Flavobacterium sp.]